jgi:DNA-binding protein H-NS
MHGSGGLSCGSAGNRRRIRPREEPRMTVEIEGLSPKELDSLIAKARKRKQTLQKRPPAGQVRKSLAALAKKQGYTLAELFGGGTGTGRKAAEKPRKARAKAGKVAPKYRHPETGTTWTGRGIPPKWLAAELAQGRSRDDFLIR